LGHGLEDNRTRPARPANGDRSRDRRVEQAIDLTVDAPTTVTEQQLKELHIRVALKS
jgi:hypothetical protein